jgi:hypothetical protein
MLSQSELKTAQRKRLIGKIFNSGLKGKNERVLIYEEERYFELGEEFTRATLAELVKEGQIVRVNVGPKRFKTQAAKEKGQIMRYFWNAR